MAPLTDALRILIVRELEGVDREVQLFPDDASLWKTMPGIANSAGNLTLHVCGNLQHFVGHVLGGTDYIRDREHEFGARSGTRDELSREIRTTVAVIDRVLPTLEESALPAPYPESVAGVTLRTDRFLLHLAAHLAFHLGQVGYLRRALTGDGTSSGAMSPKVLGG